MGPANPHLQSTCTKTRFLAAPRILALFPWPGPAPDLHVNTIFRMKCHLVMFCLLQPGRSYCSFGHQSKSIAVIHVDPFPIAPPPVITPTKSWGTLGLHSTLGHGLHLCTTAPRPQVTRGRQHPIACRTGSP